MSETDLILFERPEASGVVVHNRQGDASSRGQYVSVSDRRAGVARPLKKAYTETMQFDARGLLTLGLLIAAVTFSTASCGGSSRDYVSGFRPLYLDVVATMNRVTPACAYARRVAQLPACGRRVAAFRGAMAKLQEFVTQSSPPKSARAANREVMASLRVMQQRFATLAALIKRKDIAGFLAMGGPGRPIDNSIQRFVAAIRALDGRLPGKSLPLPG